MIEIVIQYGIIETVIQYIKSIFSTLKSVFSITLFKIGNASVSGLTLLQFSVSIILVIFVTRTAKYLLEQRILTKFKIDTGARASLSTLLSYAIGALGFLIVLQTIGLDFSSISVIIGGLGVGIGFGLQDITSNFISGITILIERKLNVGDFVEFEDVQGSIQEISLRTTTIKTPVGENVIIPNGALLQNKLTNRTTDKEGAYISLYVILSGSVEVFVEKLNKTLVTLKAGDFFGELSLLLGIPRTASVKTLEKTTLFVLNNQGFKQIIQEPPKLQEEIIQQLSTHQEELQQRQEELRKMGLVDSNEDDGNPIAWVRKRLTNLFGTQEENEPENLYSQIATKRSQ